MGAQPNRAVMKGMKFILLLAAVGLLIAAVVMLFTGRGDTGELVMAGAVLAFLGYTVVAVKSKWATSTGNPLEHLNPLHDAATGYEPGVVFAQVIRATTDYLNAGGRSPETLVADYLRLSDVMFT